MLRQLAERAQTRVLSAVYFDTEELALRKAGIVMRVRKEGERYVQTVKAANGLAVATRIEVSAEIGGRKPDLRAIPDNALRRKLARLTNGAKLKPVFGVETRRTTVHLTPAPGTEIEAAFDAGEISCGDVTLPISEFELELVAGDVAALVDCARTLTADSGLTLVPLSKSERGYAEVEGRSEAPVTAERLTLPAAASADEAFSGIIGHCLRHLMGNVAAVGARDPEGVHQMRVALRRLRSAFALFDGPFRVSLAGVEEEVRWIAGVLGRARDLDVFLDEMLAPTAASHGADARFDALSALVRARQARAWDELTAALASERFRRMVFELTAAALTQPWRRSNAGGEAGLAPAAQFAHERLSARYAQVRKLGKHVGRLSETERHALRIKLKKLRYAVDFFGSLWPEQRTKRFLKRLGAVQDVLGEMNDAAVARALVDDILKQRENGGNSLDIGYAAGVVAGWHVGHMRTRAKKLEKRWRAFTEALPPWVRVKRSKAGAGAPRG
jgi:inorganic triphosphatase YgiF